MFRDNHYVPEWYQRRFISLTARERKYFYLNLRPDRVRTDNGHTYTRTALNRWGPDRCFKQKDLYTTTFGQWFSTEIEEKFFGAIEMPGKQAVEFFATYEHPRMRERVIEQLVRYMSVQRLRTPQGLAYIAAATGLKDQNAILMGLQYLKDMHCALWIESVWSIADASESSTKFVVTDHPVAFYNRGVFPGAGHHADIRQTATHTIFPLGLEKVLILTNLSWVRNPYTNPTRLRPNPDLFRGAMFDYRQIQIGRKLTEQEVRKINLILITGASHFVAAAEKEWLYPERVIPPAERRWDRLDDKYLLMPDPRGVTFSSEIIIGYKDGSADGFDAYGRKPWQKGYDSKKEQEVEWETHLAFQGEFARLHGPRRRGRSFQLNQLDKEEDDADFHRYHLGLERYKPPGAKRFRR